MLRHEEGLEGGQRKWPRTEKAFLDLHIEIFEVSAIFDTC